MRGTSAVHVVLGLVAAFGISTPMALAGSGPNDANRGSEPGELGVTIERDVPVKMRDGVILRVDVHRPDRGGPYPVLVDRSPYGKGGDFDQFVKAGYIVVKQDARGTGASEGRWESVYRSQTHDAEDGYDPVEWAAKLTNSTGNHYESGSLSGLAVSGDPGEAVPAVSPSGTMIKNLLPLPVALLIFMRPPSSSIRSRMLNSPKPAASRSSCGSKPRP